tara:strand:+ start:118 stop:885 length:768 start_codon:yes stop_codon:yes gene_type:complete
MLTADEIDQYNETGQVTAAFRLDDSIVAAIQERAETLFTARPDLDSDYLPNLIETDPTGNWLEFGIQEQILDSIVQILGGNIILWASAFFAKRGEGKRTPWHQDAPYWPIEPMAASSAWIAFDHATPENGCMRVIPGSHKIGRNLQHFTSDADDIILKQELAESELPDTEPVDIVLEPGMVSFHHPMLLHGAEPNRSGQRRGGLVYRYMPTTSHWDQELHGGERIQGVAYNPTRQLHLVRGHDVCGKNNIYRPAA